MDKIFSYDTDGKWISLQDEVLQFWQSGHLSDDFHEITQVIVAQIKREEVWPA